MSPEKSFVAFAKEILNMDFTGYQKQIIESLSTRLDEDKTNALLFGVPVLQSKYVPKDSAFLVNMKYQGLKYDTLLLDDITLKEKPVATSTDTMRVEVYGGPHHGRIIVIPRKSPRFLVLPAQMPAGEMFREGRTSQAEWADMSEVTYELRTATRSDYYANTPGKQYLSYVEGKTRNFSFSVPPVQPSLRISARAIDLVRTARNAAFSYGQPGHSDSRYAAMTQTEKALVEYISKLEASACIFQGQQVRY